MGWINVNDRLPESAEQVLCVKEYKNAMNGVEDEVKDITKQDEKKD